MMALETMPAGVQNAGLCNSCVHAKEIESSRGARFLMCRLSSVDSRFPKYPTVPVLRCAGYAEDHEAE